MARLGEEFPLECPNCGGDIRLIAFINGAGADPEDTDARVASYRVANRSNRRQGRLLAHRAMHG